MNRIRVALFNDRAAAEPIREHLYCEHCHFMWPKPDAAPR